MSSLVLHLDMDAFFASVEQRDHPEYQGRAVIVGAKPGSRGVVSTCSYEARRYGIRSAMPISEACRRCPDGIYLRPDIHHYATVSQQIMSLLERFSPLVEPISIDEAYVDICGLEKLQGSPADIGRKVKLCITEETGLACSVGIGPNRLIAKLASEAGKPNGLKVVGTDQVLAFLDPLPVGDLRGVGKRTLPLLQRLGITHVRRLRETPMELLIAQFGEKGGQHLYRQARGIASAEVGSKQERKSISKEHTFERDVTNPRVLRDTLKRLSAQVGRSLRKKGLSGYTLTLKIRFAGFETHSRQQRLQSPMQGDGEILEKAWELYQQGGFSGRPVRLIGVGLSQWQADSPVIGDLFDGQGDKMKRDQIYQTLDSISDRFGEGAITRGILPSK